METPEIKKNIPIPTARRGEINCPFGIMEIGDSFTVNTERERGLVMSAWNYYVKRFKNGKNKKFTSRKVSDNEYRIWRIK